MAVNTDEAAPTLRDSRWVLVAFLTVLVVFGAPRALASAASRVKTPLGASASPISSDAVAKYWTPARMRRAEPMDVASHNAHSYAVRAPVSSRFSGVLDATQPPFRVSGRIFFKNSNYNGFCSGTAIDTPTRTLVLTAGHCVIDLLPRHRRMTISRYLDFVPAYANGRAPFGEFVAKDTYYLTPWRRSLNSNFDIGAITTYPNALGQNVADAVGGGEEIAMDQPRNQNYQLLGYPGFNQQQMKECDAPFSGNDRASYRLGGPPAMGVYCNMPAGSSGGPWLINGGAAIAGLTSYGYSRDAHTFSPYFSASNVGVLVRGL